MWSCVCPIRNVTACKLMVLIVYSAIMGLPSRYSMCPSQLKCQMKNFWLKLSVLFQELLSSVTYATSCPIRSGMVMFLVY